MNPSQSDPFLPCPQCGFRMKLSMEQILFNRDFQCPGCGLRLNLDRDASRQSLELLQDLHVAVRNVEALKKQSY
ncbi:MAG TPA: hypothetical protein VLE27_16970 [Thermoanaerobaculia bacterium]|nr:hypothetical protein [Thermoanaerobaculia bacterium]